MEHRNGSLPGSGGMNLRLETYESWSLFICSIIYFIAFIYAFLQARLRCWMEQRSRDAYSELFDNERSLTVSPAARGRLLYISQNVALAMLLRLVWVVIKLFKLVPKPKEGMQSCHNYHTFVSACNRLSQLLFFTAFASIITYWVEVLQNVRAVKRQEEGLQSREEISRILANSTLRRERGAPLAVVADLADSTMMRKDRQFLSPSSVQILVNFWAYASILILLTVQWFECNRKVYEWIYDGETICIAFFYGLLSVGYVVHGRRLSLELRRVESPMARRMNRYCWTLVAACVLVFPIRTVLFLLRPIFRVQLKGVLYKVAYPWFFYPLPEVIPALILLHLMTPRSRSDFSIKFTNVQLDGRREVQTPLLDEGVLQTFGSIEQNEQARTAATSSTDNTLWV